MHSDACKSIINNPVFKIKEWVKKKYEKHVINYKQTKEFEQDFDLAEKSWVELNEKAKRCKKDYYEAHKTVKSCEETAKAASTSPKVSQEQREKLEQLRALEAGMRIDVALVDSVPLGVDTPDDLALARARLG